MKEPYLEVNGVTLYLQDCIEGMREHLANGSVDVVVTSPPYNIGVKYHMYNDQRPSVEYLDWMGEVSKEVRRVLSDEGSFFLNIGSKPNAPWTPLDLAQRMRQHFILQNTIHWVKSIAILKEDVGKYPNMLGDLAVGHYKPIGGKRFLHDCHEYIFHFTKSGKIEMDRLAIGVPYQDKSNIGRWKSAKQDKRCRGNTWFIPYETIWDRETQRPHPSTFPIALPEMCIKVHGLKKIRLVMDPFIGIGSTAVACLKLGVSCVGFDIDRKYLDVASNKVHSFLKQSRLTKQVLP